MLPLQHPFGQDVASHTHWPALHSWLALHAAHAAPPLPHDALDSFASPSHVEPLQQPVHDVVPPQEHTPELQASPEPQDAHAAPPLPQSVADCIDCGTHAFPLQQPVGHDVASQTHFPLVVSHSCPVAHAAHAAPPTPQDVLVSLANASQTLPLQHPRGHVDSPQPPFPSPPTSGITSGPTSGVLESRASVVPSGAPSGSGTVPSGVAPSPPSAASSVASAPASHPPVQSPSWNEPMPSRVPQPTVAPAISRTAIAQRARTLEGYGKGSAITSK